MRNLSPSKPNAAHGRASGAEFESLPMNGFVRPRFAPTYVGYVFSARDIFLPLPRSGGGEGRGEGESLFQSWKSLLSPALLHGLEEREKGHAQQLLPRRLPPSSRGRESAQT